MSERKEALEALLALLESGTKYETMGHTRKCQKAFPPRYEGDYGPESHAQLAISVWMHDSLDAAKALYHAVLSGCSQYSIITDPTCLKVSVCWWPNGLSNGPEIYAEAWGECGNEASAWLIAIIIVLIAATDTDVT